MSNYTLPKLNIGDRIFVVQQKSRWQKSARTSTETVAKVGRKFAYYQSGRFQVPFCKFTGISIHDRDSNARCNRHGFDVYASQDDWESHEHERLERDRLRERLNKATDYRPVDMPFRFVEKMHLILDEIESGEQ